MSRYRSLPARRTSPGRLRALKRSDGSTFHRSSNLQWRHDEAAHYRVLLEGYQMLLEAPGTAAAI